jgi:hypothetical protein
VGISNNICYHTALVSFAPDELSFHAAHQLAIPASLREPEL